MPVKKPFNGLIPYGTSADTQIPPIHAINAANRYIGIFSNVFLNSFSTRKKCPTSVPPTGGIAVPIIPSHDKNVDVKPFAVMKTANTAAKIQLGIIKKLAVNFPSLSRFSLPLITFVIFSSASAAM